MQTANVADEKETAPIDPELEAHLEKIDQFLQNSDLLRAHRELSMLYWAKPRWRPAIKERIEKTANAIYFDSEPQFLQPYVVKSNDQFAVFARRYNVPWEYLAKLNHVDPKKIQPGQQLKVIKGPFSAIVELNGFLLTLHAYGYYVRSYPIGIGKDGATPLGKFTVLKKVKNPQYTDPQGNVIDGGDPNNPLGVRWLDLGNSYGIHGTIAPNSIGKAESRRLPSFAERGRGGGLRYAGGRLGSHDPAVSGQHGGNRHHVRPATPDRTLPPIRASSSAISRSLRVRSRRITSTAG